MKDCLPLIISFKRRSKVNRKTIFFTLILTLFQYSLSFTQSESIKIEDFSYKDGLTASGVNCVFKDSKGFLWLCTNNGLFRYDGYSFKNINTIANGFLKYEAYCIKEDKQKNFWIGTAGKGLFYYNTHTGRLFNLNLSKGNNSKVNSIVFFQKKILLGTEEGLIVIDDKDNIDFNTFLQAKVFWPDPLYKNSQVNVINWLYATASNKSIWVGTNGTLFELDPNTFIFKLIDSRGQYSIRCLSSYLDKKIIASSWDGGIFVVNPETHNVENDEFINEINKVIGDKRIKCALLDSYQRCWIATFGEGLYIFGKSPNGKVWFKNYRNNETQTLKIKSNFLDHIFLDDSGAAWISMAQAGLSKVYYEKNIFHYFNFPALQEKTNKEILAVKPSSDQNKFWVSFNRNEIAIFNARNYNHRQFNSTSSGLQLQKDKVSFTYQDKKGNLWIVYSRIGLYVVPSTDATNLVNGNTSATIIPIDANSLLSSDPRVNSYITCFYEDSKGRLWIGTWGETGVFDIAEGFRSAKNPNQLRANTKTTIVYTEELNADYNFKISPVNSIVEINDGRYWIGTRDRGIIEINEVSDHKFLGRNLSLNEKLPSNNIKCFHVDKKNVLWIGTNSGLCHLFKDTLKIFNIKNGLPSESINNIAEDKNHNIWISTSYGISKINPDDFTVLNCFYSDNEKLNQNISDALLVIHNGNYLFSTNESLVMFNSDSIEINQISAPIYFTDIKINNNEIIPKEKYRGTCIIECDLNESESINVPYGAILHIEFAALKYITPEKTLYKYKTSNNNEWIMLSQGQRSLNLPNINSGEYLLSIMVANSSYKNDIRSIKINYLPPFWLSKIAYLIYALLALSLLLIYRRLTIQKILQQSLAAKERFERKKIEELDKMKSEFFSNISHEFRTPLSLIINPLEKLINENDISNKNKDRIKLVLKSSNRLLKLTNELMDFSKIEKNLLNPDFKLCDIVSLTNDICLLFNNLADSMNIEFKVNYSFDQMEIPIDKGMINKVIFNLLSNAFKYTSLNGVILVNLSKIHEPANDFIKISVINTGEGISKENLNKIFDRYYQVNNIQNKNIEGTGIGLALVRSFVELHKGKAEVKSDPNLETCFDIFLPLIQDEFNNNNSVPISSDLKEINTSTSLMQDASNLKNAKPTFNYRVLIVEDETDIRNYMIEELSSEYKILSASNGEEGMNIANETIPDIIITDVIMPVLSGIELCKRLRNQVITSHIPIIILSAKTAISQQIEGLEMGADVYMVKPFNIDYLKAQILRLISFRQAVYSRYLKENSLIPKDTMTNHLDEEFMKKVMVFIEENLTNIDLSVDQLANCVSLSKVQTYRKVKAISGLSIVEFIRTVRLKKASQLILEGRLNFSEIAFETGFSTPSYFSKCFHDHFGKTPSEFANEYGG